MILSPDIVKVVENVDFSDFVTRSGMLTKLNKSGHFLGKFEFVSALSPR